MMANKVQVVAVGTLPAIGAVTWSQGFCIAKPPKLVIEYYETGWRYKNIDTSI